MRYTPSHDRVDNREVTCQQSGLATEISQKTPVGPSSKMKGQFVKDDDGNRLYGHWLRDEECPASKGNGDQQDFGYRSGDTPTG